MRIVALVEDVDHVCCRYRLTAYRRFFERAGHSLDLRVWPAKPWHWFRLARTLADFDLVVIQRKLLAPWQRWILRRAARRLAFDFDDAVFLRDSYAAKGLYCPRRRRRFLATVRACDLVVAGNDFLLRNAECPGTVIPTCVDVTRYWLAPHERTDGIDLVWVGSSSTLRGLERARPLLEYLGAAVQGLRLKLVCDRFAPFDRLETVECPWSEASEASEIAAADVGLAWIPDDDWSRGKCGLKVLQYLAAGLPVIANPVGVHVEMVQHGVTGFLAETPGEWAEALRRLARDVALRRRMGRAGRALVENRYDVAIGAQRWLKLLSDSTLQTKSA